MSVIVKKERYFPAIGKLCVMRGSKEADSDFIREYYKKGLVIYGMPDKRRRRKRGIKIS
jgi:hypothetical protein